MNLPVNMSLKLKNMQFIILFCCTVFFTLVSLSCADSHGLKAIDGDKTTTLKMASWNILNLGATTDVSKRAQVVSRFDITALQEIESPKGLNNLEKEVEKFTGEKWSTILSDKSGSGGAAEYYAFIWRDSQVTLNSGPRGTYPEVEDSDFSREPYFATFESGNFIFTLINIHVTWGRRVSERREEVARLGEVVQYVGSLQDENSNIIVMGDFNVHGPESSAFSELSSMGFSPLLVNPANSTSQYFSTYSSTSGKIGSRFYDNLWVSSETLSRVKINRGILKPHKHFFLNKKDPHLYVRRKISDHCPVWADFNLM